jgi:hypothetical protein
MKFNFSFLLSILALKGILSKSLKFIEETDQVAEDGDSYNLFDRYPDCFKSFYKFAISGFNKNTCFGMEFYFNAAFNLDNCFANGTSNFTVYSTVLSTACNGRLSVNYCNLPSYLFNSTYGSQDFVSETCIPWKNDGKNLPVCSSTCNDGSDPKTISKYPNVLSFQKLKDVSVLLRTNRAIIIQDSNKAYGIFTKYSKTVKSSNVTWMITYLTIDPTVPEGYVLNTYSYSDYGTFSSAIIMQ